MATAFLPSKSERYLLITTYKQVSENILKNLECENSVFVFIAKAELR